MQGIFVDGKRPVSKSQVRKIASMDPGAIRIEATSLFGNEYDGPASAMPEDKPVAFVGPDPYTKRNFYGQIVRKGDKITIK